MQSERARLLPPSAVRSGPAVTGRGRRI